MLIAVISDTHLPRGARRLPDACVERIAASDLLLHAGDFSTLDVLRDLEAIGPPVLGVHGNVDSAELRRLLPAERVVEAEGARIAMVHDAGPRVGRLQRMRARFGERADVVVFGHSHMPLQEQADDGFQILNPGSPTERRRAPRHTMAVIRAGAGSLSCELVDLSPARPQSAPPCAPGGTSQSAIPRSERADEDGMDIAALAALDEDLARKAGEST